MVGKHHKHDKDKKDQGGKSGGGAHRDKGGPNPLNPGTGPQRPVQPANPPKSWPKQPKK